MRPIVTVSIAFFLCLVPSVRAIQQPAPSKAAQPTAGRSVTEAAMPEVVAEVGEERILKKQLADEAIRQFGSAMLEDEIKKRLIALECKKQNVVVSQEEVTAEIQRLASTYNHSVEDWFNLLEKERGLDRRDYVENTVTPLLSITKLAGQQLVVTEDDIRREFDSAFGPSVQVRQIVLRSQTDAERVLAEVAANPDSFESVAKNLSVDPTSKPYGGLLPPMRRHVFQKVVEDAVFGLKEGQLSRIIEWPEGFFVIFKCEKHFPAQSVDIAKVQAQLEQNVRSSRMRDVCDTMLANMVKNAQIDVVMNDPARAKQYPEIAAVVNGTTITRETLAERCIHRHGKVVLQDMIGKLLVDQECRRRRLAITEADIDNEIREMAIKNLPLLTDGTPDVGRWMALATEEARVPPDVYRTNTVWPILALKKLVRESVQVTNEDVRKGYEANFGPQVRCLAIILDGDRHAHAVWAKATERPTEENFGDLAEKYSVDESRLVRGVIPAIRKFSGQPNVEAAAFKLKPGEISSLIQEGPYAVILYCLGHIDAEKVELADVQAEIVADIYEKKMNIAVATFYEQLQNKTRIVNYLAGNVSGPVAGGGELTPETTPPVTR